MGVVKEPLLNHWYRALHSPRGIELICSNAEAVRNRLYTVRKEAKDTDLDGVAICQSPFDPMRLWLVRKEPVDEAA